MYNFNKMNGVKNFSKKSEMNLLFAQSLEFQTLFSQAIDSFHTYKYYLLPKQWLDEYKETYNYNLVKPKSDKYTDYNSFKSDLLKENPYTSENISNSQNNDFPIIQKDMKKLEKYQIEYPVNFYPVKEEIFQNLPIDKNEFLYELIVYENKIFVIDNKSNKNIFICSIKSESSDLDDFVVNANYIIAYKNENIFKKEMKHIVESKGFEKYCKERNLDINKREEQEIFDKEMDKLGIFIVVDNNNDKTPTQFLINYAERKKDNQNIMVDENSYRNNNLNILNSNSEQIDFKSLSLGEYKNNLVNFKKNNNHDQNKINDNYENNVRNYRIINNNKQNNIIQNNYNNNIIRNNSNNINEKNFNQINIQNNINPDAFADNYSNSFSQSDSSNNFIQNINSNNLNQNNNSNNFNPNIQNNNLNNFNNIIQNNNMNYFKQNINQNINNLNENQFINIRNVKKVIYYFPGDIYYHIKNKCIINKSYLDSQTYANKNNIINNNPQNLEFIPYNNYHNFQNNMKLQNNYMGNIRNDFDFNNMIDKVNNNYNGNNINNIGNNINMINSSNNYMEINNNSGMNSQNIIIL